MRRITTMWRSGWGGKLGVGCIAVVVSWVVFVAVLSVSLALPPGWGDVLVSTALACFGVVFLVVALLAPLLMLLALGVRLTVTEKDKQGYLLYLLVIPITVVWWQLTRWLAGGGRPSVGPALLPFAVGTLSAFFLVYVLNRVPRRAGKVMSVVAYVLAVPISLIGVVGVTMGLQRSGPDTDLLVMTLWAVLLWPLLGIGAALGASTNSSGQQSGS